jgi:hypothetical protein
MPGHGVRDALAAPQASSQELEGIGLVGGRAGGADHGAAVAAALQQGGVRLPLGRVDLAQLPGGRVGLLDPAAKADRVAQ